MGREYVQARICLQCTVARRTRDSEVGNEQDLKEGDSLLYLMKHDDNEHWWLAEDEKEQVDYVPSHDHLR